MRAEVDFQVQELIRTVTLIEARLWGVPNYYEFDGQASGWSETQTLTIGGILTSSSESTILASPTQMPDEEPELSELYVILGVAVTVAVIGAG